MTPTSTANVKGWTHSVTELGGYSTVITNGTYGLPDVGELPNTHYFISFDGGERGMNKVRGIDREHGHERVFTVVSKMLADRAEKSGVPQTDVMLAMTVNSLNVNTIDEFLENALEWQVGGVAFGFSTPQLSEKRADGSYSRLYLTGEARNEAVRKLLNIKDKYGDFVAMSRRAIELLHLDEVARWSPECPTWSAHSFASDGTQIERCVFGPGGDCSNCGCNITSSMVALQEGDKDTFVAVSRPLRLAKAAIRQASRQS